ncbi:MAG: ParB/RepB/Spo0J family partition protein [Candidatus Paceibacterota bacterium]|jgi:ParB family chromosome partitioning protein
MSQFRNDSVFWIEVEKIKPNPYQPRREFDELKLKDLSESIRQYGILQPIVVTRREVEREDGGISTEYELIAGERRLRAAKMAGISQIPSVIRAVEDDAKTKLELAIIENLQREDLNPVDRAEAFARLREEFKYKHADIAQKVGKSREYVSNTMRLLLLPEEMRIGLAQGKISEGHTRPILMLVDRPEEQMTLYKEIVFKRITVREAESIARKIAHDRVRKKEIIFDPEALELEGKIAEALGTRVSLEKREVGGKLVIDFYSNDDLRAIFQLLNANKEDRRELLEQFIEGRELENTVNEAEIGVDALLDDRSKDEIQEQQEDDLYYVRNFSL